MATIIGCSSLPKVALSYKWIISDAKVLLKNCEGLGLRSPEFSIPVQSTTSAWDLLISSASLTGSSALMPSAMQPTFPTLHAAMQPTLHAAPLRNRLPQCMPPDPEPPKPTPAYELSLCQGDSTIKYGTHIEPGQFVQPVAFKSEGSHQVVLISDCVFSILNSETGKQLRSIKPSQENSKCSIDKSLKRCVTVKLFEDSELSKYLFNDTLTIQVSATLLCISNPTKTTLRVGCDVPPDNVRGDMLNIYRDKVFVDASIKCGNKVFKVHKAILASQSPVFRKMFEIDMKEKRSGVIEISDPHVSPEVVSDLVTYLYTGNAPGIRTQAEELLKAAHLYEIPRLLKMCEDELQKSITVANICNLLLLAELHAAQNLKAKCMEFVHLNSRSVHKTQGWQEIKDKAPGILCEVLEYCYYERTT